QFKDVATTTLWPNVLTTVAELGTTSFQTGIEVLGGWKIISLFAIGFALLVSKKGKGHVFVFYSIPWLIATFYAASTSLRFALFLSMSSSIMLGVTLSLIIKYLLAITESTIKINKYWSLVFSLGICALLMVPSFTAGYEVAHFRTPSMCDSWYNSLKVIEADSEDAIITSWWDFGHWFYSISNRRVTFDGGDQERRIHFVGRTLSTEDEQEAINILRMLNCGQEGAYNYLLKQGYNEYDAYNKLMEIIHNPLPPEDEELAKLTHCEDVIPQYFIVSQDMVKKAGVWSHFGNWDFNKARMYNDVTIKGLTQENFVEKYDESPNTYYEIKNTEADQWISDWYGYFNQFYCSKVNETFDCGNFNYNTETKEHNADNIYSIVYLEDGELVEDILGPEGGASIILTDGISYLVHPVLAKSMFTRLFFFDGAGLEHFIKFSDMETVNGERIIVYKVDFGGN
ncbi:hypothetical protein KY343_06945, partial [Candidatus Woesearchaeota archaeon]|nr:hypothetical protein [Candidatus Woesearchaeota archaeon]